MSFIDPIDDPNDVNFWRITEHVGEIVVLEPLSEHPQTTRYGEGNVMDCLGPAWVEPGVFNAYGKVTLFQEVLVKKTRPALEASATIIAKLVKPGNAYDLRPVEPAVRARVIEAWQKLIAEEFSPKNDEPF